MLTLMFMGILGMTIFAWLALLISLRTVDPN